MSVAIIFLLQMLLVWILNHPCCCSCCPYCCPWCCPCCCCCCPWCDCPLIYCCLSNAIVDALAAAALLMPVLRQSLLLPFLLTCCCPAAALLLPCCCCCPLLPCCCCCPAPAADVFTTSYPASLEVNNYRTNARMFSCTVGSMRVNVLDRLPSMPGSARLHSGGLRRRRKQQLTRDICLMGQITMTWIVL